MEEQREGSVFLVSLNRFPYFSLQHLCRRQKQCELPAFWKQKFLFLSSHWTQTHADARLLATVPAPDIFNYGAARTWRSANERLTSSICRKGHPTFAWAWLFVSIDLSSHACSFILSCEAKVGHGLTGIYPQAKCVFVLAPYWERGLAVKASICRVDAHTCQNSNNFYSCKCREIYRADFYDCPLDHRELDWKWPLLTFKSSRIGFDCVSVFQTGGDLMLPEVRWQAVQ